MSSRLAEIKWSVCISKFQRTFIIIILLLFKFFTSALADCFRQEFEWPQVSKILLSTRLTYIMLLWFGCFPFVPILCWPYKELQLQLVSLSLSCSTFFFQFPCKVEVLIFLSFFVQFPSVVIQNSKVHNSASLLLVLSIITGSGHLAEIRWSVYISKSKRTVVIIITVM